jgi:hypothetical protein
LWKKIHFRVERPNISQIIIGNTLKTILNFRDNITITKHPPDMKGSEQESSHKIFLRKLLNFTKKINIYKKERTSITIHFEEISAALTIAFCILPYAMTKMEISIYTRCK